MNSGSTPSEVAGAGRDETAWLLCGTRSCVCALPVASVIEIMRPLPVEPLSGMPPFVLGVCVIRGAPIPVIDAGLLVSGTAARATRLVTVRVGDRTVALAVAEAIGIRRFDSRSLDGLPPLLRNASGHGVEAVRALDGELALLLDTARMIPDSLLDELAARGSAS